MRKICEILLLALLLSCQDVKKKQITNLRAPFTGLEIDTLLSDTMSVRAITLEKDKVWFATDKGTFGYCKFDKSNRLIKQITSDSIKPHFRGIAKNSSSIFLISTENPAVIYRVSKKDNLATKVFEDKHPKAFYNGIQFWNDYEGIAMGDPQNDCLIIAITRDGGETWEKVPCKDLPKIEIGEAGFAASNTSLVVKGNNTWIVTGGTKARIFSSKDKGKTWTVHETPMNQGKPMAGIFTADFYNDTIGIIAGGDYENQNENSKNKALTINSGQSWILISDGEAFGYTSCIQFVPESGGLLAVSVGPQGIYFSDDSGNFWKKISDEQNLHTIRFIDERNAIAAGKNKIIKIKFTSND
ncbi:WD40/YVTN/BNR-like repeat-containing protein [Flavobacterium sp.]|uniref:WD40/YVTN/BNR-like repeat-containing protein n=1 Tax=Flavobacterium sp. TaxID=239 RepID=UPI0035280084